MYITQLLPPTLSSLPAIFILKHLLDRDCSTVLPANRYGAALISTKNAEARPQLRCTLFLLHKVTAHCLLCLRESSSRGVHLYLSNVFLLLVTLYHYFIHQRVLLVLQDVQPRRILWKSNPVRRAAVVFAKPHTSLQ